MKSVITESFKIALTESFINTIKDSTFFLQFYSENNKPLFALKITNDSIIQGIQNNKISYDFISPYDKDVANLYSKKFFGTSETLYEQNVYKLISGGTNRHSVSNKLPEHKTNEPLTLSDGYTWKFMYNIPSNLAYKFSTPYYVPVIDNKSIYDTDSSNRPPNGHGYSILYELSATSIIINSRIPGSLFDKKLTYKALSLLKTESDKDMLFCCIRCVPDAPDSPLNAGDTFTITEAGLSLQAHVEAKLKDGTILISGDDRILDLIHRNEYRFSKGSYKMYAPDLVPEETLLITIDDNKIKTIESKTTQNIITIIDM